MSENRRTSASRLLYVRTFGFIFALSFSSVLTIFMESFFNSFDGEFVLFVLLVVVRALGGDSIVCAAYAAKFMFSLVLVFAELSGLFLLLSLSSLSSLSTGNNSPSSDVCSDVTLSVSKLFPLILLICPFTSPISPLSRMVHENIFLASFLSVIGADMGLRMGPMGST